MIITNNNVEIAEQLGQDIKKIENKITEVINNKKYMELTNKNIVKPLIRADRSIGTYKSLLDDRLKKIGITDDEISLYSIDDLEKESSKSDIAGKMGYDIQKIRMDLMDYLTNKEHRQVATLKELDYLSKALDLIDDHRNETEERCFIKGYVDNPNVFYGLSATKEVL